MKGLYRGWMIFSLAALIFCVAFALYAKRTLAQGITPPPPETDNAIRAAVQQAVEKNRQSILGFQINNVEVIQIIYSHDARTALVYLAMRDLETGDILGREPGLAVARNTQGALAQPDSWQITFATAGGTASLLSSLPPELVTDDLRMRFATQEGAVQPSNLTFTGYKLPWSSALHIKITGSIGHFLDYFSCSVTSCRYAYDFWNPDPGNRMFPLLASKGGTVVAFRESCADNDHNCANYLVIRDDSTSPATYQLYYHMKYGSVPASFQAGSTYVQQGQYIGNADNTGPSTDSHLHFMVYVTPTGLNYSWGNSVQILFSDVPYNGGEPRTCAETINYPSYGTQCSVGPDGVKGTADDDYLQSGNVGTVSPAGQLNAPAAWTTLSDKTLTVSGSASDKLGIAKVEILVNSSGNWQTAGSADYANGSFSKTLDMCGLVSPSGSAFTIPDGPFALAVRIWNIAGNWAGQYTGVRQLFKNAPCANSNTPPVPACTPSADEIAVYSQPNFSGTCKKFGAGKYDASALAPVGDNKIASVQVGLNVWAVMYDLNDDLNRLVPLGRIETLAVDDGNLADNRIGSGTTSAIWVMTATDRANPSNLQPFLTFPGNQVDSDQDSTKTPNPPNPKSTDSLVLAWTGGRGAMTFSSSLSKNGSLVRSMAPANTDTWSVGTLDPGAYAWTVTACASSYTCSSGTTNSTTLNFTVDAGTLPSAGQIDAPTPTLDMEAGPGNWVASGLWRWGDANRLQPDLSTATTKAWIYNNGTTFNDPAVRAGDLTSPPIRVSAAGSYFLHFRFFSGVEGSLYDGQTFAERFWDQRRVQLSLNGGAFSDISMTPSVAPLWDDPQNTLNFWPNSPDIPLGSLSAGQIIRVRFHFDTVDRANNDFFGWAIDDLRIDTTGPVAACLGDSSNDTPATATALTLGGAAYSGRICPRGDVDYYSFSGTGGTPVVIKINAKTSNPSDPLDSFIQLIDTNGKDVIASNDDSDPTNPAPAARDSQIAAVLPRTGTFYVKVKSWDFPGAGDTTYTYQIGVQAITSTARPAVSISQPADGSHLPVIPFIIQANASDPGGTGIRQVDFYWHTGDWNTSWVKFATDTTPADGWWAIFNPTMDTTGGAFYVLATNNAGMTSGALMANVMPDYSVPVSQMNALPASTQSTAALLSWSASDPSDAIDHFDIQYSVNGGASWTDWGTHPTAQQNAAWFIGAPGLYQFRMRAVDVSGNQEAYPNGAETSTTFAAASACANDTSEPSNNSSSTPFALPASGVTAFVLCQNDTDWLSFQAVQGQAYALLFPSLSGGAAVHARLYDSSAASVLAEGLAGGPGQGLALRWTAPASGTYLIQVTPADPRVFGSAVRYGVFAGPGKWIYMPLVGR